MKRIIKYTCPKCHKKRQRTFDDRTWMIAKCKCGKGMEIHIQPGYVTFTYNYTIK